MKRGPLPPLSERRRSFTIPDARALKLTWIAEGEGWVVVSKPSGLLSVPGTLPHAHQCAESQVRQRYPNAEGGLVVHRLDLPTSGLMVFALRPDTLSHLNQQFAQRLTQKRYIAVLERMPSTPLSLSLQRKVEVRSGDVRLPIRLDPFQRPLQIYDPVHGRPSHTRWEVIGDHPRGVTVALTPVTGRTHQLRLHAAHPLGLNAPIVGDPHYTRDATADGRAAQNERLHLHAESLSFTDPLTGERRTFRDPAPFIL